MTDVHFDDYRNDATLMYGHSDLEARLRDTENHGNCIEFPVSHSGNFHKKPRSHGEDKATDHHEGEAR